MISANISYEIDDIIPLPLEKVARPVVSQNGNGENSF